MQEKEGMRGEIYRNAWAYQGDTWWQAYKKITLLYWSRVKHWKKKIRMKRRAWNKRWEEKAKCRDLLRACTPQSIGHAFDWLLKRNRGVRRRGDTVRDWVRGNGGERAACLGAKARLPTWGASETPHAICRLDASAVPAAQKCPGSTSIMTHKAQQQPHGEVLPTSQPFWTRPIYGGVNILRTRKTTKHWRDAKS